MTHSEHRHYERWLEMFNINETLSFDIQLFLFLSEDKSKLWNKENSGSRSK